jgi:hypothetical protein
MGLYFGKILVKLLIPHGDKVEVGQVCYRLYVRA